MGALKSKLLLIIIVAPYNDKSSIAVRQIGSAISNMTFLTTNFDPLTPLAPKFPNFAIQILRFRSKHTVAVVTHAHVLQNFYTTWVRGVACQKQCLGPKLEGGWTRGASKNLGPPTYLCNR